MARLSAQMQRRSPATGQRRLLRHSSLTVLLCAATAAYALSLLGAASAQDAPAAPTPAAAPAAGGAPPIAAAARPDNLTALCARWGLQPMPEGSEVPRVFDLFIASHELDMIEIRLMELADVIDGFVVLESRRSFRDTHKPLYYPQVMHRLPGKLLNKVHHKVIDELKGADTWKRETYMRNQLLETAWPATGITGRPSDIFMLGDCDEIAKPAFVLAMKHCEGVKYPAIVGSHICYYALNHIGTLWTLGPRAIRFSSPWNVTAHDLRLEIVNDKMASWHREAAWHCSYCFDRISAIQKKIGTFAHAEFDQRKYTSPENILKWLRQGKSMLAGRDTFTITDPATVEYPEYVKRNPSRFNYMMRRDMPDAGFVDISQSWL